MSSVIPTGGATVAAGAVLVVQRPSRTGKYHSLGRRGLAFEVWLED